MSSNLVTPNLNSSKNSFNISKTEYKKNLVTPKLKDLNIKPYIKETTINSSTTDFELVEKEYTFEELMNETEQKQDKVKKENDLTRKVIELSKNLDLTSEEKVEELVLLYYKLTPEERFNLPLKTLVIAERSRKKLETKIDKFTDFQNISIAQLSLELKKEKYNNEKYIGKTIGDIYLSIPSTNKKEQKKWYEFIKQGFSNLTFVEVVKGDDGFDSVVLKDTDDNYILMFTCTDGNEQGDILADAWPVIEAMGVDGLVDFVDNEFELNLNLNKSFDSQIKQARELASKYKKIAEKEDVKVNIQGFSLGGMLAEEAYKEFFPWYSYGNDKFNPNNIDCLGNLILYNSFHGNLNSSDVKRMKDYDGLKLYSAQGDFVSSIFHQDDFKDVTKYVYTDWKNEFDKIKKRKTDQNMLTAIFGADFILKLNNEEQQLLITALSNFDKIFAGPHLIEPALQRDEGTKKYKSFNEDGSVKEKIETATGTKYVGPIDDSEIQKYVLGTDNLVSDLQGIANKVTFFYNSPVVFGLRGLYHGSKILNTGVKMISNVKSFINWIF